MRAKFIYEAIGDILKPKSKEEIQQALKKLSPRKQLSYRNVPGVNLSPEDIKKLKGEIEIEVRSYKEKIKQFAEQNGYEFGINKNKTPYISIPTHQELIQSYDQLSWPTLVLEINYTFTYTDQDMEISLRKIWYGQEPVHTDYWEIYPNEAKFEKFREDLKTGIFPMKNLKQNLMGRFKTIEEALERAKLNIQKELRKQ
jgi:hypothetical protein